MIIWSGVSYATVAEFKVYARINDAVDDTLIQLALDATTQLIDEACGTETIQIAPVPARIKLACLIQAARLFKRQDSPFGVLGSEEFGNYVRIQSKLDPDVEQLLGTTGERLRWGTTV